MLPATLSLWVDVLILRLEPGGLRESGGAPYDDLSKGDVRMGFEIRRLACWDAVCRGVLVVSGWSSVEVVEAVDGGGFLAMVLSEERRVPREGRDAYAGGSDNHLEQESRSWQAVCVLLARADRQKR